jgi:hypothetical protein
MASDDHSREVLIGGDASELAFRIGQTVQRYVLQSAIRIAKARGADVVSVNDVNAAAAEIEPNAARQPPEVASDGKTTAAERPDESCAA